jgi:hypothetical protein
MERETHFFPGGGGRLILTNTCLSSLSMYTMGFYILPPEAHRRMDTVRSRFFWRGAGGGFQIPYGEVVSNV